MLVFLEPPHKASQNLRMLLTYKAMRLIMKNGMQRLATPSLEDVCALHEGTKSEREALIPIERIKMPKRGGELG